MLFPPSIVETFHAVAIQCIATISSTMTNAVIVSPSFYYVLDRMATVLNGGYVIACSLWLYLLMTSQTKQAGRSIKTCEYNYITTA